MHTATTLRDPYIIHAVSVQPDSLKLPSCLFSKSFYKNRNSLPIGCFHYSSKHISLLMQPPRYTSTCYFQKENSLKETSLPVQTLSGFPIEKLNGEVVLVRIDTNLVLNTSNSYDKSSLERTIFTIKYLYSAKARVLIATRWAESEDPRTSCQKSLSDYLSSLLQLRVTPLQLGTKQEAEEGSIFLLENLANFSGELANCPRFSKKLAHCVTIFVDDAFSLSHRMLASTVGVAGFCHVSLAGFNFEKELSDLLQLVDTTTPPYFAIIGGDNFSKKAPALQLIASKCDGLFFIGKLAFQIMKGLNLSVPHHFLEKNVTCEVEKLIQIAQDREVPIFFPTDFVCAKNTDHELSEIFGSDEILTGWTPVDIGPKSLEKISSVISSCKKILWIGPPSLRLLKEDTSGASHLAAILHKSSNNGCEIFSAGNIPCNAMGQISRSSSQIKLLKNTTVLWEFLKGRTLPGIAALDKAYPYAIRWDSVFSDPSLPLVVDIGSGNGLFLFQMAKKVKDSNFLGLEMNKKLVSRCRNGVLLSKLKNLHFISTNATSSFGPIVSSYPGKLVLATIQCPNPDFNKGIYRWKMVQRTLVEAIIDLLAIKGKVFLQSDVEAVTIEMREQFITYGKGKVVIDVEDGEEWMEENPFGVRTDWELHTIARGNPMYRTMLRKIG
ncbi:Phosphoglycerate kinase [Rhynchospora pubera]|uniref:Phosphoglycerate kinase n=1 Tax=Rhynchospora pubera TaxID=906938 RepID=A0AAV8E5Q9_9POAL|nr:Phosphoglycerate kinase [Rhynchospora pubera]